MGAFTVERDTVIDAPAATVFGLINSFHEWRQWSPWEGTDPTMDRTYSGPEAGPGATYSWHGNRKAGTGTMTITETTPDTSLDIDLRFDKPFAAHNTVRFDISHAGAAAVRVTWTMSGETTGIAALIGKVIPMDRFVGRDFERGLAAMKAAAETSAHTT